MKGLLAGRLDPQQGGCRSRQPPQVPDVPGRRVAEEPTVRRPPPQRSPTARAAPWHRWRSTGRSANRVLSPCCAGRSVVGRSRKPAPPWAGRSGPKSSLRSTPPSRIAARRPPNVASARSKKKREAPSEIDRVPVCLSRNRPRRGLPGPHWRSVVWTHHAAVWLSPGRGPPCLASTLPKRSMNSLGVTNPGETCSTSPVGETSSVVGKPRTPSFCTRSALSRVCGHHGLGPGQQHPAPPRGCE